MDQPIERNGVPAVSNPQVEDDPRQLQLFDDCDGALNLQLLTQRLDQQGSQLERVESLLTALVEKWQSPQPPEKMAYTPKEFAKLVGLEPETVQGHLREGRIEGFKTHAGRGREREWRITRDEYVRFRNEGLLPPRRSYRHPR